MFPTLDIINYFLPRMRKIIAYYLAKCLECQQFKVEHQHLTGLLHPLPISMSEIQGQALAPDRVVASLTHS